MSTPVTSSEGQALPPGTPGGGRRHVGVLLRTAFHGFVDELFRRYVEEGFDDLRPAHSPVFQHLDPDGSRLTTLAAKARMTSQSMGYLVDYLERQGYVERIPDPTDRRATLIRATERGRSLNVTARRLIDEIERDWAATIGERRYRALVAALEALDEELSAASRASG